MKPIISASLRILSMLCLLSLPAHGQTPDAKELAEFEFSCASWDSSAKSTLHYFPSQVGSKETTEETISRLKAINVTEMTRSLDYDYKGDPRIVFYQKGTTPEGGPQINAVAATSVPIAWKKVLFVFFPGKEVGKYRVLPIRDERKYAPFGSYQFLNFSDLSISAVIDKEKVTIDPKGKKIVKLSGDQSRSINLAAWATIEGKQQWLVRNTLTYKPNKHLIYFFYPTKDRRGNLKIKSKGIVAFRPPTQGELLQLD